MNFWYYTSFNTAKLILQNKSIHINNIALMNDVDEINLHYKEKGLVHCLCVCNSNTEKIPMWYLYAGITGKGVAFGFTPAVMLKLINSINTLKTVDGKTLYKGRDFDVEWGWIFYRKNESKSEIFYKRKWYYLSNPKEFEINNYFIKNYPWEYEREFRIVIHNKTGIEYEKFIINIESVLKEVRIKLAPEISMESFNDMLSDISLDQSYFTALPKQSGLSIQMNLCKRNIKGFIDFVDMDMRRLEEFREIEQEDINAMRRIFTVTNS